MKNAATLMKDGFLLADSKLEVCQKCYFVASKKVSKSVMSMM